MKFLGSQDLGERYPFLIHLSKLYLVHPRIGKDIDKEKERVLFEAEILTCLDYQRINPLFHPLVSWTSLAKIKSPQNPN